MNESGKTKVTVHIFGVPYRLMSTSSETYVKKVAALVDEQMRQIAESNPRLDMSRLAVLAAIRIADEYLKQKDEQQNLKDAHERQLEEERRRYEELKRELNRLQTLHEEQLAEYERKIRQYKEQEKREQVLLEDYRNLQEEYSKLQKEFNEWIQMVGLDEPAPNKK